MTRVLVPVSVLEGETVSVGMMNLLRTVDVTVLGYQELPEQTPPDQARIQYEDQATEALEDLTERFQTATGTADHRLVFTHDQEQTVDRIADELDAEVLGVSGMTGVVDRLLVSLTGKVAVDRILGFVEELVADRDMGVTLFMAADDEAVAERLEPAAERLREGGLTVETVSVGGGAPFEALVEELPGHDAVIMGERAPSFRSLVFGEKSARVASASVGPVLVVRSAEEVDEESLSTEGNE